MSSFENTPPLDIAERSRKLIQSLTKELVETNSQLLLEIERDERLVNGLVKRDEQIHSLKRKIETLEAQLKSKDHELEEQKSKLEKLEKAKSVILQRKFWSLRKKFLKGN